MNYCPNCGLPYNDGESQCFNCGMQLKSASQNAAKTAPLNAPADPYRTRPLNQEESYAAQRNDPYAAQRRNSDPYASQRSAAAPQADNANFDQFKQSMKDTAGKALVGAQGLANQVARKVGDTKAAMQNKAGEEVRLNQQRQAMEREQRKKRNTLEGYGDGSQFMSSSELWSWLKQDTKRQMFCTENGSSVTEEEFMQRIYQQMYQNGVPAKIIRRSVQWDRSNTQRTNFFIKPVTNAVNPLACMVQLNHVGKFTFVEEKTFIMPPELPEVPMKPMSENASLNALASACTKWGLVILLAGLFLMFQAGGGLFLPLLGAALLCVRLWCNMKNKAISEHNKKCAEMEREWAAAWQNWQNSIFLYAFQEDVNGQLSRVFDAVFECIKQVNGEMFAATKVIEEEESSNINELEQLIARRKDEYR